jgi:hypothetical protein
MPATSVLIASSTCCKNGPRNLVGDRKPSAPRAGLCSAKPSHPAELAARKLLNRPKLRRVAVQSRKSPHNLVSANPAPSAVQSPGDARCLRFQMRTLSNEDTTEFCQLLAEMSETFIMYRCYYWRQSVPATAAAESLPCITCIMA